MAKAARFFAIVCEEEDMSSVVIRKQSGADVIITETPPVSITGIAGTLEHLAGEVCATMSDDNDDDEEDDDN